MTPKPIRLAVLLLMLAASFVTAADTSLYLHLLGPEHLLTSRIYLGQPIMVRGKVSLRLDGTIERRGTNLVADLQGSVGAYGTSYQGEMALDKPYFSGGGRGSGGAGPLWFAVSTNADCTHIIEGLKKSQRENWEKTSNQTAGKDLAFPLTNAWDKSFIVPLVEQMERTGSYQDALALLNFHHADWSQDADIPPRLSKVVMKAHPTLANPLISPKPEDNRWYSVLQSLAQTRDPAMVPVLRRFLKIKVIDGEGLIGGERTPRRVCDSAAVAIKTLLGYPLGSADISSYSGVILEAKDYPLWKEWDQKIEELEKQLDAAPLTIPKTP